MRDSGPTRIVGVTSSCAGLLGAIDHGREPAFFENNVIVDKHNIARVYQRERGVAGIVRRYITGAADICMSAAFNFGLEYVCDSFWRTAIDIDHAEKDVGGLENRIQGHGRLFEPLAWCNNDSDKRLVVMARVRHDILSVFSGAGSCRDIVPCEFYAI